MSTLPTDLSAMPSTFVELLHTRATQQPDRRAYTFLVDGETEEVHLTYQELDRQARAIAAMLQGGAAAGERALLLYPPGLDYIAAFFGCLYAGVVAVPAYPPDPMRLERTLPRLQAIIADARPQVVLTTSAIRAFAEVLTPPGSAFQGLRWLASDSLPGELAESWQAPTVTGTTLALLQYTSGSTSAPRGVMLTHANLLHNSACIQRAFGHTPASRGVIWLPPYHDMGLIGGIVQPLYAGFGVVLLSPLAFLQRPIRWLQAIARYQATTSGGPNFAYDLCVRKIGPEQRAALDLSSWTVAFNGAEPIRPETLARFADAFAPCGFRPEAFYPCYGLAEATLIVTGGELTARPVVQTFQTSTIERNQAIGATPGTDGARTLVGCGRCLPDQQILIVDPSSEQVCPPNSVGEIWVAGPSVAAGYWDRPAETAQSFQARLTGNGAGPFLRTGDLGFVQDGELFVTGRLKDLIIIRGRNHYPQDVELTVERSHPALRPGCGAAFGAEIDGEERLVVVQEVERQARDVDVEAVAGAIRQAVAAAHEMPVYAVALLRPNSIPKTSSGKVQRHACRNGFLAGALEDIGRSILDATADDWSETELTHDLLFAAPADARQRLLATYLQEQAARVLRVAPSRLDVERPIHMLGLDSLMALELQHSIETRLGTVVPMTWFLQDLSIAQLAAQLLAQLTTPPAHPETMLVASQVAVAEYPLSFGQRALWFLHQLAPESSAYNIPIAVRIRGELDIPALRRVFQKLVDRHPSLRTTFAAARGEPLQQVHPTGQIAFQEEQAAGWSPDVLHEHMSAAAYHPFDLAHGPLLRVHLFTCSAHEHMLLLVVHHIVADLWSMVVLAHELDALYPAERAGHPLTLAPLPLQYADYVRWQTELLAGPEGERLWTYWRQRLAGPLPAIDLPTDRPRPSVPRYRGAAHALTLDAALAGQLHSLAQAAGTTLYTTILAAFQALLYRYTEQEDMLIGCATTGRNRAELAGVVGYFVNLIPIRADLGGNPAFSAFLAQTHQTVLESFARQEYPLSLMVERLQPERDSSRAPLFQVVCVLQKAHLLDDAGLTAFALNESGARMRLGGVTLESITLEQRSSQFDLMLMMAEVEGGITGTLQYNIDLFDAAMIARMAGHLQTLLGAIGADSSRRLADLPLLTEPERQQLLVDWNNSGADYPRDQRVHELFAAQAGRTPDAVALVSWGLGSGVRGQGAAARVSSYTPEPTTNDQRPTTNDPSPLHPFTPSPLHPFTPSPLQHLTYHELNVRANQLAHYLQALGVGPDVRVGLCMERSLETIIAIFGILKAGAAYVPLDPAYPQERLAFMLEDTQAPVLLTQRSIYDLRFTIYDLEESGSAIVNRKSKIVNLDTDWAAIERMPGEPPENTAQGENIVYVIYTSGSTGRPKGVMVKQRGLVNLCFGLRAFFDSPAVRHTALITSISFDISVNQIFPTLIFGRTLHIIPDAVKYNSWSLIQYLDQQRINLVDAVPSYLMAVLTDVQSRTINSALKYILIGGEKLEKKLLQRIFSQLGAQVVIVNIYGLTEISDISLFSEITGADIDKTITIGQLLQNNRVYILNRHGSVQPVGIIGELCISGDSLSRGYLHRPELTVEKFVVCPFGTGELMCRTGDVGRWLPDGTIELFGRIDHQVKVRGFRIEVGEIEAVLEQHPAVREAVVLAREDVPGNRRLVAYVVTSDKSQVTSSQDSSLVTRHSSLVTEWRGFLKQKLPEYMIPSVFVTLPELPHTPNGKVDRRALPAPDSARLDLGNTFVAPRTRVEQVLADIWAEVLGVAQIGIYDNFFDLGGHSLLATQLVSRVCETFRVDVSVRNLFETPVVSELAVLIAQKQGERVDSATLAQMLSELDQLSEEEVRDILATE